KTFLDSELLAAKKVIEAVLSDRSHLARTVAYDGVVRPDYAFIFGTNFLLSPEMTNAGTFKYRLVPGTTPGKFVVDDKKHDVPVFGAGGTISFVNQSEQTLRVSFKQSKIDKMSEPDKEAASTFQLPVVGDNVPALVLAPGYAGSVTTYPTDEKDEIYGYHVNIEVDEGDDDWDEARGGGNGPDMGINNP
ncbi:MAG: hypothetical protein V2I67_12450, partial [Thermoanaerobaculales bacterium]|nr:hypothetical protein [Thermoanaerobaculales bacterium]